MNFTLISCLRCKFCHTRFLFYYYDQIKQLYIDIDPERTATTSNIYCQKFITTTMGGKRVKDGWGLDNDLYILKPDNVNRI